MSRLMTSLRLGNPFSTSNSTRDPIRFTTLCALALILASILFGAAPAEAQTATGTIGAQQEFSPTAKAVTPDQAIDRIVAREREEIAILRQYRPIVETYIQDFTIKGGEPIPWRDWYFLGEADLSKRFVVHALVLAKDQPAIRGLSIGEYLPSGFLQEIYIDQAQFDRQHYEFSYVGREFLGEVRCLVFDVAPLPTAGQGRFKGRIWVEDQQFTIVRFSGGHYPLTFTRYYLHIFPDNILTPRFDSWRLNVQPGLWLPAYVFSERTDIGYGFGGLRGFRAQTRLWGYDRKNVRHQYEFSDLSIESNLTLHASTSGSDGDPSPVQAQREWQARAEVSALDALQRAGMLAAAGEMDERLNAIVNNLEVSNHLDFKPPIRCRVLTTSNLEMFFVGRTIILSRGLIDVVPNEATLAALLAQELVRIEDSRPSLYNFGFGDFAQLQVTGLIKRFNSRENSRERDARAERSMALVKNSPYGDKMAEVELFASLLRRRSATLTQLLNPNLGDGVRFPPRIATFSPALEHGASNQVAALPIGGRIALNPWDDSIALLKVQPAQPIAERERAPFGITPFMPFLTQYKKDGDAVVGTDQPVIRASTPVKRASSE